MKAHTLQTSFVSGVVDEAARGRTETAVYRNGAQAIRNGMLLATGGCMSRWGTLHLGTFADGTEAVMEEFAFSDEQSYVAVFTDQKVSFFYSDTGEPAGFLYPCPWTEAQLPELRFAQGGDVMWVVMKDIYPMEIRRTGTASWALSGWTPENWRGIPVFRYADPRIVGTYTASGQLMNFSAAWLDGAHTNTAFRIYDTTNSVYRVGYIAAVYSPTQCEIQWETDPVPDGNNTTLWEEQAFSGVRGFFRSVCLYQQRLVFGGARDVGDAIWASQTGRFWSFDVGTALDTDGLAFALGATRIRTIRHVVADQQLVFLTDSVAFWLPEADDKPLTPAGLLRVRSISAYGVGNVRPGSFDGGILMVQNTGRAVRDIAYSEAAENLIAEPVSLHATDVIGEIVDAAYLSGAEERPEQYAFFVTSDGRIAVFHSIREQKIGAWAEWTTDGLFKAVAVASGRVFAAVLRDGTLRLEQFRAELAFDAAIRVGQPFVAPHLAGYEVHGRQGNDYLGSGEADEDGELVLTREQLQGSEIVEGLVELGLGFEFYIDPLPPSLELPDGSLIGRPQRVLRTGLRLYNARAAQVETTRLTLLYDGFTVGEAPPNAAGWWHAGHLGWARRGRDEEIVRRITRNVPMPVGVLALRREVIA